MRLLIFRSMTGHLPKKVQPGKVPGKKTIITVLTGHDRKTGNLTGHDR